MGFRVATDNCFKIAHHFEGCKLSAYQDGGGKWTIGIGTTIYPDGKPVQKGHTCTLDQAKMWFLWGMQEAERKLNKWLTGYVLKTLEQHKVDALLSCIYNVGYPQTLIEMVNKNPDHKAIWGAFLMYVKEPAEKDGKDNDKDGLVDEKGEKREVFGLLRRRNSEAHLYFKGEINFYEGLRR